MAKPRKKAEVISNNPAEDIAPISPYGAVEFTVTSDALEKLAKQSAGIKAVNSTKDVAAIMPYIAALRDKRVALVKEKRVLKEGAIAHGKLCETEANTLINIIQPEETRLQAIRKVFEDAAALVKQEKIEAEMKRTGAHKANIKDISELPAQMIGKAASIEDMTFYINELIEMDTDLFEEFSEQAKGAIETATSVLGMAVRLAEGLAAQAQVDADNAAEAKRIGDMADKAEAYRKDNEKEAERLKQEKADQEAKIEQDKQAAAKKISDATAAAKQKIIDDKAAKDKAEADKKAAAKAEKTRLADIEKNRPDAEKLIEFAHVLKHIVIPISETNQGVVTWITQDLETLARKIVNTANEMIS